MEHRETPVSREALYEEVWRDPMTIVAPRYGLSDVGLMKICKKLRIPVPGRGYWAKVKAGRPTRKLPLLTLAVGARMPPGPIPLSVQEAALRARVQDALLQTRRSQPAISVPSELIDPHPLVRAAAARLRQRDGWDHPAGVRSATKEVLDIQVTKSCLDRALRLMGHAVQGARAERLHDAGGHRERRDIARRRTTPPYRFPSSNRSREPPTPRRGKRCRHGIGTTTRSEEVFVKSIRTIPQFDWHATGKPLARVHRRGRGPRPKGRRTHPREAAMDCMGKREGRLDRSARQAQRSDSGRTGTATAELLAVLTRISRTVRAFSFGTRRVTVVVSPLYPRELAGTTVARAHPMTSPPGPRDWPDQLRPMSENPSGPGIRPRHRLRWRSLIFFSAYRQKYREPTLAGSKSVY